MKLTIDAALSILKANLSDKTEEEQATNGTASAAKLLARDPSDAELKENWGCACLDEEFSIGNAKAYPRAWKAVIRPIMKARNLLAIPLLFFVACAPQQPQIFATNEQAQANYLCSAQAMQVAGGERSIILQEMQRNQAFNLCSQAWGATGYAAGVPVQRPWLQSPSR